MDPRLHPPLITLRHRSGGFTLVELMVVIGLLAVITTLAAPSWVEMRTRNNVRAAVNDFTASLHLARSEAVRLNTAVTVCSSNDGANCTASGFHLGWIVKTGTAANTADQVILQDVLARESVVIDVTGAAARAVTFLPNGRPASNFNGVTLAVCPTNGTLPHLVRTVVLNRTANIVLNSPATCPIPS